MHHIRTGTGDNAVVRKSIYLHCRSTRPFPGQQPHTETQSGSVQLFLCTWLEVWLQHCLHCITSSTITECSCRADHGWCKYVVLEKKKKKKQLKTLNCIWYYGLLVFIGYIQKGEFLFQGWLYVHNQTLPNYEVLPKARDLSRCEWVRERERLLSNFPFTWKALHYNGIWSDNFDISLYHWSCEPTPRQKTRNRDQGMTMHWSHTVLRFPSSTFVVPKQAPNAQV